MLADEVLARDSLEIIYRPDELAAMKRRIGNAMKFDLAPDFAAAAEEIAMNFDVIANVVPSCRLPYPETWIEVAHNYRPAYSGSDIHVPGVQHAPHRVGFLLTATDKHLQSFKVHEFWNFKDGGVSCSDVAVQFDPSWPLIPALAMANIEIRSDSVATQFFPKLNKHTSWEASNPESRRLLSSYIKAGMPDFVSANVATGDKKLMAMSFELAVSDWSGEACYLLAVLGLLNTVNASEAKPVDLGKLNKARVRNGKPALANHYALTIHPRLKKRMVHQDRQGTDYLHLRAHICRGHWKARKTGVFYWRPHMRGDRKLGTIDKTYRVDA